MKSSYASLYLTFLCIICACFSANIPEKVQNSLEDLPNEFTAPIKDAFPNLFTPSASVSQSPSSTPSSSPVMSMFQNIYFI